MTPQAKIWVLLLHKVKGAGEAGTDKRVFLPKAVSKFLGSSICNPLSVVRIGHELHSASSV